MYKCLIALISLFPAAAMAAPAWTWVDEQGRRHYSDVPVEGATQIELSGSQTFSGSALRPAANAAATASTASTAAADATDATPAVSYTLLEILSPTREETFNNIGAQLPISVATFPALRAGHRFDVIYDGVRRAVGSRTLEFTLNDVFRGEHTITILIVDAEGQEIRRSAPVTFFVRQTSLN